MNSINYNSTAINFKATPLMKTSVLKKTAGKYLAEDAHLVEMNSLEPNDVNAITQIKEKWSDSLYAKMIYIPTNSSQRKIYALTSQTDNFSQPEPDKIMGLADFFISEKNVNLKFLQVSPEILNDEQRQIKGVGRSLIQSMVSHLSNLGIETMDLFAEPRVKPFYKKVFPKIKDKESTKDSYTNLILNIK